MAGQTDLVDYEDLKISPEFDFEVPNGLEEVVTRALAKDREDRYATAQELYDALLPRFAAKTGIEVRVVAVGTGQAIKNAQNCDGDVLLVHAKPAEEKFVAEGYGVARTNLMFNDFVIVGPGSDPAGVAGTQDVKAALTAIRAAGVSFASRGDNSGTHKAEMALWQAAGIDPTTDSGGWYRETGSGMGATIRAAVCLPPGKRTRMEVGWPANPKALETM